jgi:hypothetical protein
MPGYHAAITGDPRTVADAWICARPSPVGRTPALATRAISFLACLGAPSGVLAALSSRLPSGGDSARTPPAVVAVAWCVLLSTAVPDPGALA